MACGDVVAALVGVAAAVGDAAVVGVVAVVTVLDEPAAGGVEVVGTGAESAVDEVVVAVEPVVAAEFELPAGVACDWLSASCRS